MTRHFSLDIDRDGIATLALDVPGAPLNMLSDEFVIQLDESIRALSSDAAVRGILVTSAKAAFAAGWNLLDLVNAIDTSADAGSLHRVTNGFSKVLRRLETCGKPVVAAINGLALGGGLEIALACHHRILADTPSAKLGLPEVKVGLLPGGGGTQRLPRLIGVEPALRLMLDGGPVGPAEALRLGMVDQLVPPDQLTERSRAWLLSADSAVQPWDRKDGKSQGSSRGALAGDFAQIFMTAIPDVTRKTLRNYPAPVAILSCVYEGLQLPVDRGLDIERHQFVTLARRPEARNLIRTMFINKGKAEKLARRPQGVSKQAVSRVAVLGAGMMGAGLSHSLARASYEVSVLDVSREVAGRAVEHTRKQLEKDRTAGRVTEEDASAILSRIRPTDDYADLAGSDFVIEAVFEKREIKTDAIRRAEAVIADDAVFASNTSTLPVTGLAEASKRPHRFIGMHFFSPVERMPLVEIIRSKMTDDTTLAWTLDLARRLGKTPIVVNDSRGFFTSRVFGTYCYEGQMLLKEGVNPALIENAGRFAGMPVGPLAVMDEVSLELQYHVVQQTRADLAKDFREPPSWDVLRHFVEDLRRVGRKAGGGFYEYPSQGKKYLWPGLTKEYPTLAKQPSLEVVKQRLLFIQSLETARCLEEGVLTSGVDGDLGSILGWGFPAYTGGAMSFIDMIGVREFVEVCKRLAAEAGPRFEPCELLLEMARTGRRVYGAT
ncbi:MAG: 3-hydroxyacyl-CoA dehydrogenase NAD-binding domain-containing protein [Gammaproteobacteria bacterium]